MRKSVIIIILLFLVLPFHYLNAEDFLGAPVIPGAESVQGSDVRLELKTGLSHDDTVGFYKKSLERCKDIRFREWKDATYIEDDGNRPWHSITISKLDKEGTTIVIIKDNWTWIIGTLILRFVGVFIVLLVLYLGMALSGRITASFVKRAEVKKAIT
jgi:hypothetical protein